MTERSSPFPRERRILRRRDFDRLMQTEPVLTGPVLVFAARHAGPSRLGVIVPKRFGKAVLRNRARRRLREAFRLGVPEGLPVEMVVLVRSQEVLRLAFGELVELLRQAAEKAACG